MDATYSMVKLTQYHVPEAETFNLLGGSEDEHLNENTEKMTRSMNKDKTAKKTGRIRTCVVYLLRMALNFKCEILHCSQNNMFSDLPL